MPTSPLRLRNRSLLRSRFGWLPRSVIVWCGSSNFNHAPIELVLSHLTFEPSNAKIGDMVQAWIIAADEHPQETIKEGRETGNHSVCGNCEHYKSKACYVNTKYIGSIYRGQKATLDMNNAEDLDLLRELLAGFILRMGAWGDPMAVPAWLWLHLAQMAKGHTGYTHAWSMILRDRAKWAHSYSDYRFVLMASTDSAQETAAAQELGWRTFEVVPQEAQEESHKSRICPNFSVDLSCAKCRLCDGLSRGAKRPSIWIPSHGMKAHLFRASASNAELIRATMPWLS